MTKIGTVFSELLKLIPRFHFDRAVNGYHGDRYVKSFTAWQQFITILYSQITRKDSLREIETGLVAQSNRWYHLGLTQVRRSTLADANNRRDYRIFEDLFYCLLKRCKNLTPKHKFRFKNSGDKPDWVAMCYYLLLAYIKYQTRFAQSLLYLSRVIRETLMDRKALIDILTLKPERLVKIQTEPIQYQLIFPGQ